MKKADNGGFEDNELYSGVRSGEQDNEPVSDGGNYERGGYTTTGGIRHYETAEEAGEEVEEVESAAGRIFVYLSYSIIFATLVALCFFLYEVKVVLDDPCVPNNVFFLNENLGGTNYKNLERVIKSIADKIGRRPIYLSAAGNDFMLIPSNDIDFKINTGFIYEQAFAAGNQGNLFQRVKYKIRLKTGRMKINLNCRYYFNRTKLENLCSIMAEFLNTSPESAVITETENGYKKIKRNVAGVRILPEDLYRYVKNELSNISSTNFSCVTVAHESINPPVTLEDKLNQLNSNDTLSIFETNYITDNLSIKNNVESAARLLDGIILKPLEVFSFNNFMGAVKYKNERDAAIFNSNRLGFFPDVSGGAGIFASALYNAILFTHIEILERHNHSYYDPEFAYCPPGRDAQVIFGSKDLKFMPDKDSPPLVFLCSAAEGRLKISIHGRRRHGETIDIETAEVNISEPVEKKLKDYSIGRGERKIENKGLSGYELKTVKIVNINGEQNYKSVISTDVYASMPKLIRIGDSSEE